MKYQMSQRPGSGAQRAYVLGARLDSGNIGDAIVNHLFDGGWHVLADDCLNPEGYGPPTLEQFEEFDADALIVTLGRTYNESFDSLDSNTLTDVLDANLLLPLEAARRYVEATKMTSSEAELIREEPFRIIFIGSYGYEHPFTNGTLYCAAKAGLDAAARALGWELTDKGYRIHIVHPYHVQGTPMWSEVEQAVEERYSPSRAHAYVRKDLKMPDLLVASEVAEVVHALLAVPALQWTSGTGIKLYGGTR